MTEYRHWVWTLEAQGTAYVRVQRSSLRPVRGVH